MRAKHGTKSAEWVTEDYTPNFIEFQYSGRENHINIGPFCWIVRPRVSHTTNTRIVSLYFARPV